MDFKEFKDVEGKMQRLTVVVRKDAEVLAVKLLEVYRVAIPPSG